MVEANSAAIFRLLVFLVKLGVHALRAIFRTREQLLIENPRTNVGLEPVNEEEQKGAHGGLA